MAADPTSTGTVWYEAGDASRGLLTKVVSTASVLLVPTGTVAVPEGAGNGSRRRTAGVAPDRGGGVLIARPTAVMRFAETDGLVTVAGGLPTSSFGTNRSDGSAGNGGPLMSARFTRISAMTADAAGNVFVADEVDPRRASIAIRFLNRGLEPVTFYRGTVHELTVPPGTVATVAGATAGGARGPTVEPELSAASPKLAVAGERLYVGSTVAGARRRAEVRMLNLSGTELSAHGVTVAPGAVATVATVVGAAGADDAPGAELAGLAADGEGNVFLAESSNHRVRRVDASGAITTYAGTGAAGFNGNDRPATTARLDHPYDVEIGAGGRVYISDAGNSQIRFVDQAGIIHVALGNGAATTWRCASKPQSTDKPGVAPSANPASLAADERGNVYLASRGLARVHRLTPSGTLRPVAGRAPSDCGQPADCEVTEGAPAIADGLVRPEALAVRPRGGLYLLDGERVRFVNLSRRLLHVHGALVAPGAMRTVAQITSGNARTLGIRSGALAADSRGNLFVADAGSGRVRQVDAAGVTTTIVTGPAARPGGTGNSDRCCTHPAALALDDAGNLYIADVREQGRVWFLNRGATSVVVHGVTVAPGALEPVAASGGLGVRDDGGRAVETQLLVPSGLAVDRAGNLYVIDRSESTVRRVDAGGTITTAVGSGAHGFNGDGLKGPLTTLRRPTQVVIDACGNLLVADTGNDRIRRLNLAASCQAQRTPGTTAARPGASLTLAGLALAGAVVATGLLMWRRRRRSSGDASDRSAAIAR